MTTLSLPNAPVGKAHPHPRDVCRAELTKFRLDEGPRTSRSSTSSMRCASSS